MKRTSILVLLIGLLLSACAPASTPTPAPTVTPTLTLTLSSLTDISTPTPHQIGYALEFTQQVSSGMATLHVSTHTCSGVRGPWEGTFDVELVGSDMQIGGSGSIAFTLPSDGLTARGEAPYSGSSTGGTICAITGGGPLQFEITFSPDGRTANVMMGSTGGETMTFVCGDDQRSYTIPFAIAWGPEPLTVPITPYGDCP